MKDWAEWCESFASELEDDDNSPAYVSVREAINYINDMEATSIVFYDIENFKTQLEGDWRKNEIRSDRNPPPIMTGKIDYGYETVSAPGFTIYKYNPVNQMIGNSEIEQIEEERKRQTRQRHLDEMREIVKKKGPTKEWSKDYDPGYPYETIGELVEAMLREAAGDAAKLSEVRKWSDDLRRFLAGNLWGYNAQRAAEEAQRAAQETKPDKQPEPERKPVKGEDNLLTIADISKNGN